MVTGQSIAFIACESRLAANCDKDSGGSGGLFLIDHMESALSIIRPIMRMFRYVRGGSDEVCVSSEESVRLRSFIILFCG